VRSFLVSALALAGVTFPVPAFAQDAEEYAEDIPLFDVSAKWSGALLGVPGPAARFSDPDLASGPRGASYAGEFFLTLEALGVTDAGLEFGAVLEGRLGINELPAVSYTGGTTCSVDLACPAVAVGPRWQLEAGEDLALGHDRAFVFVRGGWGEAILGEDDGVADRLGERAPDLFEHAQKGSPDLDPFGVVGLRVANDFSNSAQKLSLTTPRLVGVMLGASFTPKAENGAEYVVLPGRETLRDITEVVASFSHKFVSRADRSAGEGGIRVSASYSYLQSDIEAGALQSHCAGVRLDADAWSVGAAARWGEADQLALAGLGKSESDAWEVGATHALGAWTLGASYGQGTDDIAQLDATSWRISAARDLAQGVVFVAGWADDEVKGPWASEAPSPLVSVAQTTRSRAGLLFELRFVAPLTTN
jgi:hypothetical protein